MTCAQQSRPQSRQRRRISASPAAGKAPVGIDTNRERCETVVRPRAALEQARRVVRPGSPVVIATWAVPERCEAAVYLAALGSLLPAPPPGAPGPFALSAPGALEDLATEAGLAPRDAEEVSCPWHFEDLESALSAMLAAGPAIKGSRTAGEERVRRAVAAAIEPFVEPSGGYMIGSAFRYLVTTA